MLSGFLSTGNLCLIHHLKVFVFKSLLTTPSSVLPLHLKQTFLPIISIFTEAEGIESRLPFKTFSTLLTKFLSLHIINYQSRNSTAQLSSISDTSKLFKTLPTQQQYYYLVKDQESHVSQLLTFFGVYDFAINTPYSFLFNDDMNLV